MLAYKHATAVRWLLPVYLLAVTAGGWFHNHPHRQCCGPSDGADCQAHALGHSAGHNRADQPAGHACGACSDSSPSDEAPCGNLPSGSCPEENCPVCHFMAQKPAPVERVEEVTSAPLPEQAVSVRPSRIFAVAPSLYHSRAPPSVA